LIIRTPFPGTIVRAGSHPVHFVMGFGDTGELYERSPNSNALAGADSCDNSDLLLDAADHR
jgi:hypothetical protein